MSDENLNFCERLKKMMGKNGYKNAAELSRAFFQTGIKEYKKSKKLTHIQQEHNLKDQINTHLRQPEFGKVSLKNISLYCRLLGCSSDYLLGVIDHPTYEIKSVSEQTGLSETAAEKIARWNQVADGKLCSLLSEIIENPLFDEIMIDYITSLMGYSDGTNPDNHGSNSLKSRVTFLYMVQQAFTQIIKEMSDRRMSAE